MPDVSSVACVTGDNQLTKNGVCDLDLLRDELQSFEALDFDLDSIGFNERNDVA